MEKPLPQGSKVYLVVGGLGLLGRAVVERLAATGAQVVVADRMTPDEAQASAGVSYLEADITDDHSVAQLIESTDRAFGRIDGLVHAAYPRNRNYGRDFFDVVYADFSENLSMNLGGMFLVCQQAAAYMRRQGFGSIVNIGSIYGTRAPRFEIYGAGEITMPVEYAAIKAGQIHLVHYLAKLLKGSGVRVNTVSPGGILDGQDADFVEAYNSHGLSKGMLAPGDVTGAILFLLSDDAAFVNGQNLIVDDGWTL